MEYYRFFTYDELSRVAGSFYSGTHLPQNLENAQLLYESVTYLEDRTDEN